MTTLNVLCMVAGLSWIAAVARTWLVDTLAESWWSRADYVFGGWLLASGLLAALAGLLNLVG